MCVGGGIENEQLLGLLDSADRGPSVQAAKALATVRTLQEMLVGEREAFAERETGLTRRLWGLESAVKESVGDLLRERRVREELEWRVWPKGRREEEEECAVCMAREEEEGRAGKGVVEMAEEGRRAEEVKVCFPGLFGGVMADEGIGCGGETGGCECGDSTASEGG